ncbi:SusD family protein [compost metagenome]
MDNLEKIQNEGGNPIEINPVKGSALFFRAFSFWQIAQLYAKPYTTSTAAQNPGIPLRLKSDINEQSSRGTVQDTYSQIIQDLTEALSLLPNTSTIVSSPNKTSAYAMLARTYLSMQDYPKALINANAALQIKNTLLDYNTVSLFSPIPFPRFNNLEVIFHSVCGRSNILAPGIASTSIAKIDRTLVASYTINDLRRRIFLKANSGLHTGTFRFTGNYEPTTTSVFFNGLAVDELYLIRAECYARAGNTTAAMKALNDLLFTRWTNGTYVNMTAATPAEALSKILQERRKELLMRGLRWSDLRRLNNTALERKTDGDGAVVATLPINNPRNTLLIPADVINLSHISQNVR